MLASEALQRVVKLAGDTAQYYQAGMSEDEQSLEFGRNSEAIEVCTNILSVAVPLARFRCYVTIEKIGLKSKLGLGDFTVCGLDISSIKNGLVGLSMEEVSVYIQLWEHRNEGKFDMLCGYQGKTKNLGFRNWLRDIDRHQELKQTNNVELPRVPSEG